AVDDLRAELGATADEVGVEVDVEVVRVAARRELEPDTVAGDLAQAVADGRAGGGAAAAPRGVGAIGGHIDDVGGGNAGAGGAVADAGGAVVVVGALDAGARGGAQRPGR